MRAVDSVKTRLVNHNMLSQIVRVDGVGLDVKFKGEIGTMLAVSLAKCARWRPAISVSREAVTAE